MAINFVSTSILTSDDGIDFSTEEALETEQARKFRLQKEDASKKPLYMQLQEQRDKKQAEQDAITKLMNSGPSALDEEDIEFFKKIEESKLKVRSLQNEYECKAVESFKESQKNRDLAAINEHNDIVAKNLESTGGIFIAPKEKNENKVIAMPVISRKKRKANDIDTESCSNECKSANDLKIIINESHDPHQATVRNENSNISSLLEGYASDD